MSFSHAFSQAFPRPFGGVTASAAIVLLYDTFTDTDGTAITSHAPNINLSGGGWAQNGTGSVITSNRARASTGQAEVYAQTGQAQTRTSIILNAATNGTLGFITRWVGINQLFLLGIGNTGDGKRSLLILEKNPGYVLRASQGTGANYQTGVDVAVTGITTSADVTIADTATGTTLTYPSTSLNTGTRAGFRFAGVNDRADDIQVTTL